MKTNSLFRTLENFFVLQDQPSSQVGVMRLEKGRASSAVQDCDSEHDQTLLLVEGELVVEVGNAGQRIGPGTSLTVPAGVKHRFINHGNRAALAFTVLA